MKSIFSGLLVGAFAASFAACGGKDDEESDTDTETGETGETGETDEPEPDYFEPWLVDVDGVFAYDAGTDTIRSFFVDGAEVPSALNIVIYDERIQSTSNIEFACSLELVPTGTPASGTHAFDGILDSGGSYNHWGMTLKSGEFEVRDAPFTTQSGTIEGCLTKELDPALWGDDFAALFEGQDWGIFVGDMAPEVGDEIEAGEDDPNNDYDLISLYDAGFVIGGSQSASEYEIRGEFYYSYGFAVDTNGWTLVDSGNEDDPFVRLAGADMIKTGEKNSASGVYQAQTVLFAWQAKPLLLGIQQ